jgi:hypothetical protein
MCIKKATQLMDELASLCGSHGWDFYGAIFNGPDEWCDHLTEGGNNFIRQCTKISCTSQGLQRFLNLPYPAKEHIDEALILQKEKPQENP